MTHEPECKIGKPILFIDGHFDDRCCCACIEISAAYQRGREDAAKAVADMDDLTGYDMDGAVWQDKAIAAARGDAGCQHDWQHLKGEKCPTCRRCGAARGDGEQA